MLRMGPHRRGLRPIRVLVPEEALIRVAGTGKPEPESDVAERASDFSPLQQSLNLICVNRRKLASLLASKSYLTN
jgi:hypothetical protein